MDIRQNNAESRDTEHCDLSERRLWIAVLLQALEDWKSNNMRRRSEAEKFLFENEVDFARVCLAAGLAPESVLTRLRRMKDCLPAPIRLSWAA
jgi:hypothetical protein